MPFCDQVVAELALALPRRMKVRGLSKKRLLRHAVVDAAAGAHRARPASRASRSRPPRGCAATWSRSPATCCRPSASARRASSTRRPSPRLIDAHVARPRGPQPPDLGPADVLALARALRSRQSQSAAGTRQATSGELRTANSMPTLLDAILAFCLALVVVWIATPVVKTLAWRIGAIDEPRERGLHQLPTARLGGLAILAGIVAAGLVLLPVEPADERDPGRRHGDRRGGHRRRPARPVGGREVRGPGAGGGRAGGRGRAGRDDDAALPRPPRPRGRLLSADRDRDRRR